MRHLLLTGEMQAGKSTLIRRLLAAHPKWQAGGFQTVTRWEGRHGSVHLIPARAGLLLMDERRRPWQNGPRSTRPLEP